MKTTAGKPKAENFSFCSLINQVASSISIPVAKLPRNEIVPEHLLRNSLCLIRYLLFILTSAFYLAGPPAAPLKIKIGVVFTMLMATLLSQNLYDNWDLHTILSLKWRDNSEVYGANQNRTVYSLAGLIIIETMGVALLLLPTGGLDSPFTWYALNPIIAAAIFLPGFICWGVLALFLTTALAASEIYPGISGSLLAFMSGHTGELLIYFVSTSSAQVAAALYNQLTIAYERLNLSHATAERSLEHISSLYQALEAFTTREDHMQLADVLAVYAGRLCEQSAACLLLGRSEDGEKKELPILRVSARQEDDGIDWQREMNLMWNRIDRGQKVLVRFISPELGRLIALPVISHGEYWGLLAYLQSPRTEIYYEERKKSLSFLTELGGIIIGRLKTNRLWGRLLVSEEQNRISNEIHDGVSQYLFSIGCALHALSKENAHLQDARIQEQLSLVEETARRASSELRTSIYHLSPSKRGESIFIDNLASYLDELGRLNGIQVDLQAEGSEDVLSPALRKGLYRIVREACSNAIRHGQCSLLEVRLCMAPGLTTLEIEDNGCSFEGETVSEWKPGLGITNMKQIAARFYGELEIVSQPGRGTLVRCSIPKSKTHGEGFKEAYIR